MLAIRTGDRGRLDGCLRRLVPILQRAQVAFMADPRPALDRIVRRRRRVPGRVRLRPGDRRVRGRASSPRSGWWPTRSTASPAASTPPRSNGCSTSPAPSSTAASHPDPGRPDRRPDLVTTDYLDRGGHAARQTRAARHPLHPTPPTRSHPVTDHPAGTVPQRPSSRCTSTSWRSCSPCSPRTPT